MFKLVRLNVVRIVETEAEAEALRKRGFEDVPAKKRQPASRTNQDAREVQDD